MNIPVVEATVKIVSTKIISLLVFFDNNNACTIKANESIKFHIGPSA